ncbi:hypothetical protein K440DRAFT_115898 [Wilcoxina mikolae CBS 423.85]|nr:hypothetical protein K440DRAFT_115898 [Wilcoxina mikolae CBS 423.85]
MHSKAIIAVLVAIATAGSGRQIAARSPQGVLGSAVDAVCPLESKCGNGCMLQGNTCCDDQGFSCVEGTYCDNINGVPGCCPNGQVCS